MKDSIETRYVQKYALGEEELFLQELSRAESLQHTLVRQMLCIFCHYWWP